VTIIPANHRLREPIPPSLCAAQTLFPDPAGPSEGVGGKSGYPIQHMLKKC